MKKPEENQPFRKFLYDLLIGLELEKTEEIESSKQLSNSIEELSMALHSLNMCINKKEKLHHQNNKIQQI